MTIEDAARLASFPLWFPKTISPDWRTTVGYLAHDPARRNRTRAHPPVARRRHPPRLDQRVTDRAAQPQDEEWETWTTVEREGLRLEVAKSEHGPTRIRLERERTSNELMSDLEQDTLFELALALERV